MYSSQLKSLSIITPRHFNKYEVAKSWRAGLHVCESGLIMYAKQMLKWPLLTQAVPRPTSMT